MEPRKSNPIRKRVIPFDLDTWGKDHEIEVKPKFVIVAFGDTSGFREWEDKVSPMESANYMSKLNKLFLEFRNGAGNFVKTLADGMMAVQELSEEDSIKPKEVENFIIKIHKLLKKIFRLIENADNQGVLGFRVRIVIGWAWRMEIIDQDDLDVIKADYTGKTVSLAFTLLQIQPRKPIICYRNTKEIVERQEDKKRKFFFKKAFPRVNIEKLKKEECSSLYSIEFKGSWKLRLAA